MLRDASSACIPADEACVIGQSADGVVRIGCSCYTTSDEIERLLVAVRQLQ